MRCPRIRRQCSLAFRTEVSFTVHVTLTLLLPFFRLTLHVTLASRPGAPWAPVAPAAPGDPWPPAGPASPAEPVAPGDPCVPAGPDACAMTATPALVAETVTASTR